MKYFTLFLVGMIMLINTETAEAKPLRDVAYFHTAHMADHWKYWYGCEYNLKDESDPSCLVYEVYLGDPKSWKTYWVEFVMYAGKYALQDRGSCFFTLGVRRTVSGRIAIRHGRGDFHCDTRQGEDK